MKMWSLEIVIVFALLALTESAGKGFANRSITTDGEEETHSGRSSKLYPLFTLLRLPTSEPCRTEADESGLCLTRAQCTGSGGVGSGSCAQRFGVCCTFAVTCMSTINTNGTFFQNPGYPSQYQPLSSGHDFCQVRIRKQPGICQLRLNFISFELDGPTGPTVLPVPTAANMVNQVVGQPGPQYIYFNQIPPKSYVVQGQLVNQQGQLVDKQGQPTTQPVYVVNADGQLVNHQSQLINPQGLILQPGQPPVQIVPISNSATTMPMMNDAGRCKTDSFTVSGSGIDLPTVCGTMTGQHMYINFGRWSDSVTLNLNLAGNVNRDRVWNVQVIMLRCGSEQLAPDGCLQYFQSATGVVTSFNWGSGSHRGGGGTHLANMDYSVCVRLQEGMRAIEWSACNAGDVKISGQSQALSSAQNPTVPVPPTCGNPSDYLIIPQGVTYPLNLNSAMTMTNPTLNPFNPGVATLVTGSQSQSQLQTCKDWNPGGISCQDRFCDTHFENGDNVIKSSVLPFLLHFKTDGAEITQAAVQTDPQQLQGQLGQPVPGLGGGLAANNVIATTSIGTTDSSGGFCLRFQQTPQ